MASPESEELASLRIERAARPLGRAQRGRRRRWLAVGVVVVGLVVAVGWWLLPLQVGVAPAIRGAAADDSATAGLNAAGYIVADRQSTVSAKYTARLARLLVREAAVVEKGQLLAELDHGEVDAMIGEATADVTRAEAAVAQAAAGIVQAEAQVTQARDGSAQAEAEQVATEAARRTAGARLDQATVALEDAQRRLRLDETLFDSKIIEASRVDDRRTEVRLAQARVAAATQDQQEAVARIAVAQARIAAAASGVRAAEAQVTAAQAAKVATEAAVRAATARLATLRARLDDHFVRAPFAGVVTERIAEEGEIVAPVSVGGTQAKGAIVTLIESASLQAEVDVTERHLARVKPGGRARITVDALPGEAFAGTVQRLLPLVDRGKATVKTRVDFRRVDPRFLPDMGVRVRFLPPDAPAGVEDALAADPLRVPTAALVREGDEAWVWVVAGDRARRQSVKLGATHGDRTEITAGLDDDTLVVIAGHGALRRDGQRVRAHRVAGAP